MSTVLVPLYGTRTRYPATLDNITHLVKRSRVSIEWDAMVYLFHGENQPALRDALLELKEKYEEAVFWEKEPEGLSSYLLTPSLFAKKELVIIEDADLSQLLELIKVAKRGRKDVAFIFSEKIPSAKLPRDEGLKIIYFREEIPKNVFPFLDALAAKDKKRAFAQAHRLLQAGEDFHFLLTMIVWQMRNLAKVKGKATKGLHPYVLGKLKRLEKNFTEEELSRAFSLLLAEDLKAKRGKANSTTLDFLIEKITSSQNSKSQAPNIK